MISVRTLGLASFALCGALYQQTAAAEIVVGGGGGVSQISKYKDVDDGTAYRIFGGYRATDIPLYVEAQYFDSGKMDIDDIGNVKLQFDGWTASVGYRVVLGDSGSDLILKGGGYVEDSEAKGPGGSVKDDRSGGQIGIGGNWMFTPNLGLNFDVQILFGVEDFANREDLTIATVGLIYSFYEN